MSNGNRDFTPVKHTPEDLASMDIQKKQVSDLCTIYGYSPVDLAKEQIAFSLAVDGYLASIIGTGPRVFERWYCGLIGCHHATRQGAAFHGTAMRLGMPSIHTGMTNEA